MKTVGMTTPETGLGEKLNRYRMIGRNQRISNLCIGGVNYFPGDEVEATANVMAYVVTIGRAVLIDPDEIRDDDPVVEQRDPVRRGRKTRRQG